jgi:hypothetical protein
VLEKSQCFTIKLMEQNSCRTIGLFTPQETPKYRGRARFPNFGIWPYEFCLKNKAAEKNSHEGHGANVSLIAG